MSCYSQFYCVGTFRYSSTLHLITERNVKTCKYEQFWQQLGDQARAARFSSNCTSQQEKKRTALRCWCIVQPDRTRWLIVPIKVYKNLLHAIYFFEIRLPHAMTLQKSLSNGKDFTNHAFWNKSIYFQEFCFIEPFFVYCFICRKFKPESGFLLDRSKSSWIQRGSSINRFYKVNI